MKNGDKVIGIINLKDRFGGICWSKQIKGCLCDYDGEIGYIKGYEGKKHNLSKFNIVINVNE